MAELRFDGLTAVITGAARGIGRAHALLLASRGANVVVADNGSSLVGDGSSSAPADALVSQITAEGGHATACCASVADPEGARKIVRSTIDRYGRLDILINNAGISDPQLFAETPSDQFQRMLDVHYLGTVNLARAAWEHLGKGGHGRIVNTCSEAMLGIHPMVTSYGGAKGGVFGLTRVLAAEGPAVGIHVNAVAPRANTRLGNAETVMRVFRRGSEAADAVAESLCRMPPEQVAPAAAFLAHRSCALNGEVLVVGGGQVQRLIVQLTKGATSDAITPEFVVDHLDRIMASDDAQLVQVNSAILAGSQDKA